MQRAMSMKWFATLVSMTFVFGLEASAQDDKTTAPEPEISVYTTREQALVKPLLRLFEGLTKVKVNDVYLTGDPHPRLADDASAGKVDLFIASEFGQLTGLKARGLTDPVPRGDFVDAIPANYRDPEGHWFGLTRRMRVIALPADQDAKKSMTYEELSDHVWKGRLCVRSGLHPYNVTLVASLIAHKGSEFAENWLRGVKANLARAPKGGDRDQIAAVVSGECKAALVNSYYLAAHNAASGGSGLGHAFPNATDRGTHVSVSGMALAKGAPNRKGALLLMDFLTSKPVQFIYAHDNHEYPIRRDVRAGRLLTGWGSPNEDVIPLGKLAALQDEAAELVRKVEFDQSLEPALSR